MPLFGKKKVGPTLNRDGTMELDTSCLDDFVTKNPRVVVMFYRSTCGHSLKMDPIYVQLCSEMKGPVEFCKVSTPANAELVRRLAIKGTPTFVFFVGGKEMGRAVGERTKEALKAEIVHGTNAG
jgi:thiol-disulfide isomerase/thioredoxin